MSDDRVNQPIEYKTQGSRVYAQGGGSYNCTNRVTATELCQKLNQLEKTTTQYHQIEQKLDKLTKQIIRMQMTLSTLNDEMQLIKETLE